MIPIPTKVVQNVGHTAGNALPAIQNTVAIVATWCESRCFNTLLSDKPEKDIETNVFLSLGIPFCNKITIYFLEIET